MTQDDSHEMITIAVEPYEQETQSTETSVVNPRGGCLMRISQIKIQPSMKKH